MGLSEADAESGPTKYSPRRTENSKQSCGAGRKAGNSHRITRNVGKPRLFIRQAFGTRDWEEPGTLMSSIIQRQSLSLPLERNLRRERSSRDALQRALDQSAGAAGRGTGLLFAPEPRGGRSELESQAPHGRGSLTAECPVISKGVRLMTSLSRPISRYLHNDSIDLNSPQSFGCLHHPFLPALLRCDLLLPSTPRHQPGLSAVPCEDISLISMSRRALTFSRARRREGRGSGTFRSLRKLSAAGMLFLETFSCLNHQLFPPPLLLLCWAMTHLDTRQSTNNYRDAHFISDHFLPPLPARPARGDSPLSPGISGHGKIKDLCSSSSLW